MSTLLDDPDHHSPSLGAASSDQPSTVPVLGLTAITSSPTIGTTSEIDNDYVPTPQFRARSRSPGRFGIRWSSDIPGQTVGAETPPNSPPTRWWYQKPKFDSLAATRRPWRDPPKRRRTIPEEQTEGWEYTKMRVGKAAASVLGTTGDVVHEVLILSAEALEFVPIPGLSVAAKTLLTIWDTLQAVDLNRLACLRLTERCADILLSIRQEIHDAGDAIGEELADPIHKLVESFKSVQMFLQKQAKRPFLKRYLKREEILILIRECDANLTEALGMFSLSIQIRILRQVQDAELKRDRDTKVLLDSIKGIQSLKTTATLPALRAKVSPSDVLPTILAIQEEQNSSDTEKDFEDLAGLIRTALGTSSDVEILSLLQIDREEMPEAIKTLQRALERMVEKQGTDESQKKVEKTGKLGKKKVTKKKETLSDSGSGSGEEAGLGRDTLHREFIESGIDALKRMSKGVEMSLPSWTITRYEVDRDKKIGIGFFSDVYKGTWHGRTVAIKVLAECTPRELFRREVEIWKQLKHENVLELYGASSASGDPPWFFVSPYEKNGSLVHFLKLLSSTSGGRGMSEAGVDAGSLLLTPKGRVTSIPPSWNGGGSGIGNAKVDNGALKVPRECDLFRYMLQIAKGMEYLHANGVLHGDLKGANVLVADKFRCVISDFGQSEMKSEVYRISRTPVPHGTLRWQAPELMSGSSSFSLTPQMDVYSYAILCIEILGMGRLPWPLVHDESVRHFVLNDDARPPIPNSQFDTPALQILLSACWHREPGVRPTFEKIVQDVRNMRKTFPEESLGQTISGQEAAPHSPVTTPLEWEPFSRTSPDMRPSPLPGANTPRADGSGHILPPTSPNSAPVTLSDDAPQPMSPGTQGLPLTEVPRVEASVSNRPSSAHPPIPVVYTPSTSRSSSLRTDTPKTHGVLDDLGLDIRGLDDEPSGTRSPPPVDERSAMMRDERRYRLLLEHSYHPSLTLPLWTPAPIALGAVGYLSKPAGSFVTLFNSLSPENAYVEAARGLPSLYGYGKVVTGSQRQEKRHAALRKIDAIIGILTFIGKSEKSDPVSRRYSFQLRAGHKAAYIYTETTLYQYIERLEVPKKWFKANVDTIMRIYGSQHNIQKEDLYLVIGTLDTPDYALFVSHSHPDGQAHFNVYSNPRNGQPWGHFTTGTEFLGGPSYQEPSLLPAVSTSKISTTNDSPWDTVLIAKLRFKPDASEPTSL